MPDEDRRPSPPRPMSAAQLAARAFDQARGLLRREADLARAELDASARRAGAGLGLLAVALVLSAVALNLLCGALVAYLAGRGLPPELSGAVLGGTLALLAGFLVWRGLRRLADARHGPTRAAQQAQADAARLSEVAHGRR